jgi:hypothetical protein
MHNNNSPFKITKGYGNGINILKKNPSTMALATTLPDHPNYASGIESAFIPYDNDFAIQAPDNSILVSSIIRGRENYFRLGGKIHASKPGKYVLLGRETKFTDGHKTSEIVAHVHYPNKEGTKKEETHIETNSRVSRLQASIILNDSGYYVSNLGLGDLKVFSLDQDGGPTVLKGHHGNYKKPKNDQPKGYGLFEQEMEKMEKEFEVIEDNRNQL